MAFDGEMRQELVDFRGAPLGGVADLVEENVARDPMSVSLLGASAVVARADGDADAVEEFWRMAWHGVRRRGARPGDRSRSASGWVFGCDRMVCDMRPSLARSI